MASKKDVDYYQLFCDAIEISCSIADKLAEIVRKYSPDYVKSDLALQLEEIHKLEHEGDLIYSKIAYELNRAFITPIEREDNLSHSRLIMYQTGLKRLDSVFGCSM